MVEQILDMPPGTLGFRISDRLVREDYVQVLVPPLGRAVDAGERLHSGAYIYRRGRYRLAIFDRTQGKRFQVTSSTDCVTQTCDHSTAAVWSGVQFAGHAALADYGKVGFSGIAIRDTRGRGGVFTNHAPWRVKKLIEVDTSTHHRAASPSRLGHGGTRFSDRWLPY